MENPPEPDAVDFEDEMADLLDLADLVMRSYVNTPEARATREAWLRLKEKWCAARRSKHTSKT